jgi:hypothetical protein
MYKEHSRQVVVVSYLLRGIRRIIRVRLEGESVKRAAIRQPVFFG